VPWGTGISGWGSLRAAPCSPFRLLQMGFREAGPQGCASAGIEIYNPPWNTIIVVAPDWPRTPGILLKTCWIANSMRRSRMRNGLPMWRSSNGMRVLRYINFIWAPSWISVAGASCPMCWVRAMITHSFTKPLTRLLRQTRMPILCSTAIEASNTQADHSTTNSYRPEWLRVCPVWPTALTMALWRDSGASWRGNAITAGVSPASRNLYRWLNTTSVITIPGECNATWVCWRRWKSTNCVSPHKKRPTAYALLTGKILFFSLSSWRGAVQYAAAPYLFNENRK